MLIFFPDTALAGRSYRQHGHGFRPGLVSHPHHFHAADERQEENHHPMLLWLAVPVRIFTHIVYSCTDAAPVISL